MIVTVRLFCCFISLFRWKDQWKEMGKDGGEERRVARGDLFEFDCSAVEKRLRLSKS